MKLTLLGTGTPAPSLKRACSGYVIEVGDDVIVMDHGPDAHRRFLQSGRRATQVTHAFFTHLHYDHCLDYGRLVLQRWDQGAGEIPELAVYGPPPIAHMTKLLFGDKGVYDPDLTARCNHQLSLDIYTLRGGALPREKPAPAVTEIGPGDKVEGNGWTVRVGESRHVQPYLQCQGYRLDSSQGSICYTGDSGGEFEPVIELAAGCDVLIHMTHYESGTEPSPEYRDGCGSHLDVARVAQRAGVGTLVLTHLLEQIDRPGTRERLLHEMASHFGGRIVWGEDLMEIPIVRDDRRHRSPSDEREW